MDSRSLLPYQALVIVSLAGTYLVLLAIYRLYFHPLAKFPGPKLAAISAWYAGYHDLVRGGQYVRVVEEMHRQYGPIVRVRPDVLHVNDPNFIDKLYSQSPKQRRERYRTVLQTLHAPGSILATQDHDLHKNRRAVLNPYFSKQNVRRLAPITNETLATLLRRMDGWAKVGKPVQMGQPFRAATKDIIQSYALGDSEKYLDMEDCNAAFFDVMTPQRICHLGTYAYWLAAIMANLPPAIMTVLLPRIGVFSTYVKGLMVQIDKIRDEKQSSSRNRTIFHEIMQSDIPESEKETKRLTDEAMVIVIAGSETTATTLCAITYHLLADRKLLNRVKAELETVMPNPYASPDANKLDNLPLFNAVIQETIRLHPGASHRQDRTAPDEDLLYEYPDGKTLAIPAGTGIGMTAPTMNRNPDLYDRPTEFLPDRYLENPKLYKYQMSFSKGARQCIGINLAYQELQTLTAGIFRRYDLYDPDKINQDGPTMELYHTNQSDIAMYADYITPAAAPESKGLRVLIRN